MDCVHIISLLNISVAICRNTFALSLHIHVMAHSVLFLLFCYSQVLGFISLADL